MLFERDPIQGLKEGSWGSHGLGFHCFQASLHGLSCHEEPGPWHLSVWRELSAQMSGDSGRGAYFILACWTLAQQAQTTELRSRNISDV